MAQIINAGTQTGEDIFAKIKQLIDNECEEILIVKPQVTTPEESEPEYQCDIIGVK